MLQDSEGGSHGGKDHLIKEEHAGRHLDVTVLGAIARNDAPHSAAVALASRVFPVPAMATRAGDLCLTHLTSGNAVCTSRSSRAG